MNRKKLPQFLALAAIFLFFSYKFIARSEALSGDFAFELPYQQWYYLAFPVAAAFYLYDYRERKLKIDLALAVGLLLLGILLYLGVVPFLLGFLLMGGGLMLRHIFA